MDGRCAAQAVVDVPGEGLGRAVRTRQREGVAVGGVAGWRRLEAAATDRGVGVHTAGCISRVLAEGEGGVAVSGGVVGVGEFWGGVAFGDPRLVETRCGGKSFFRQFVSLVI